MTVAHKITGTHPIQGPFAFTLRGPSRAFQLSAAQAKRFRRLARNGDLVEIDYDLDSAQVAYLSGEFWLLPADYIGAHLARLTA